MFYYSGKDLKAVRMEDHKLHVIPGSKGGLPNYELYNIARDPAEKFGAMYKPSVGCRAISTYGRCAHGINTEIPPQGYKVRVVLRIMNRVGTPLQA